MTTTTGMKTVGDRGTAHEPRPLGTAADWRLRVDGEVRRPMALSIADLKSLSAPHRARQAIQCVSAGGLCGPGRTVTFEGVSFATIAAKVGAGFDTEPGELRPCVEFISRAPGFCGPRSVPHRTALPLSTCLDPECGVMVAWAVHDQPLPYENGGPLRSVVGPSLFFYKSMKWLAEIRVIDGSLDDHRGTWEAYAGYHNRGRVAHDERFEPVMRRITGLEDGEPVSTPIDDDAVRRATFDELYGRGDLSPMIASQLELIVGKNEFPKDFTGVTFAKDGIGAQIRGTNFARADFCGAKMAGANFSLSKFPAAVFSRDGDDAADMQGCDLEGAHLQNAHLRNVSMRGAYLAGTTFVSGNLERSTDRVEGLDVRDAINLDEGTIEWLRRNGAIVD